MLKNLTTLGQFLIERQGTYAFAKGEFTRVMADINIASKIISREVNKAGLANIIGRTEDEN
jgi:fructose-1,6-bisphosphatase I